MFKRQITFDYAYGIVAKLQIKRSGTSTSAGVVLFDLSYYDESKSGNATACAAATDEAGKRRRGVEDGFYQTLDFGTLSFSTYSPQAYKFAAVEGVFFWFGLFEYCR